MIVCCRENRYRLVENINYIYDQVFIRINCLLDFNVNYLFITGIIESLYDRLLIPAVSINTTKK